MGEYTILGIGTEKTKITIPIKRPIIPGLINSFFGFM